MNIQDTAEPEEDQEEDYKVLVDIPKSPVDTPYEDDDIAEEELQEDIPLTELDRLEVLRDELSHDRKNIAFRAMAVWFFQVSFSLLIIFEAKRNKDIDFENW